MKHVFGILTVVMLSLAMIACDNVILPDRPGGGGSGDTTGTGGGDRDSSDTGGGDRDTTHRDSLFIGGPIVTIEGLPSRAMEKEFATILWDNGRGEQVVYGKAKISQDRTRWSAHLVGPLPEKYLYAPRTPAGTIGTGVHGFAIICLTNKQMEEGQVIPYNSMEREVITAQVARHVLIYYTGREMYTAWASPWIENFETGYSMGIPGFIGYVPVEEREYVMTRLFRI